MSDTEDQHDVAQTPPQAPSQTEGGGEQVKPEPTDFQPINIRVQSSTGEEVFFKIKRNTKLAKLRGAYATRVGKDVNSFRFLYEGDRITDEDTPATLDMEDNDTIEAMVEQVGGSSL